MTLTPAYGRTYKKQSEVLADWGANKDFLCHTPTEHGIPINKEQVPAGTPVQFRFGKRLEKVLGHIV